MSRRETFLKQQRACELVPHFLCDDKVMKNGDKAMIPHTLSTSRHSDITVSNDDAHVHRRIARVCVFV